MNDYVAVPGGADAAVVVDRQVLKGHDILNLCLQRGKSLSMKGFIDSQIEKGVAFIPVVERMVGVIDHELELAHSKEERALLQDLHNYADAQLRAVQTVWLGGPPGEG